MTTLLFPTIVGGQEPFDIRKCPIWAIPQLAFYKRLCDEGGVDMEIFEFRHGRGVGLVIVGIAGQGIFQYSIVKQDMNNPENPLLFPSTPATKSGFMIGDRVKSHVYRLEGEIQDILPCDSPGCDKTMLTLETDYMDSKRRYFHTTTFFRI